MTLRRDRKKLKEGKEAKRKLKEHLKEDLCPPPNFLRISTNNTMPAITLLAQIYHKIAPLCPPGLATAIAASYIGDGKFFKVWRREFVGTLLMIGLTFTPGKWIGADSLAIAWTAHAVGVVAADKLGGGQHVNPAVTCSMYALGKCSYTEAFVRISGAMGGGLVGFPLFKMVADYFNLTPLGGPEFDPTNDAEGIHAAFSEAVAVVLLLMIIYTVNWELNFGTYHYWIKQTLTALGIRYIIETFPTAGPSINPMLATTVRSSCVDVLFTITSSICFLIATLHRNHHGHIAVVHFQNWWLPRSLFTLLLLLDCTICSCYLCKCSLCSLCRRVLVWNETSSWSCQR